MRIATLGEDWAHDAVLRGLAMRWCSTAEVLTGEFRGKSKGSRRAQLRAEYQRLMAVLACDCATILLDADEDKWDHKVNGERSRLPAAYAPMTVIGSPERNIECWLSADVEDFCHVTGASSPVVTRARKTDPKGEVQAAIKTAALAAGLTREAYVAKFVHEAPLAKWMQQRSFKAFVDECAGFMRGQPCGPMPNEEDSKARTSSPPRATSAEPASPGHDAAPEY